MVPDSNENQPKKKLNPMDQNLNTFNISLLKRLRPRFSTLMITLMVYYLNFKNKKQNLKFNNFKIFKWLIIHLFILNWRAIPFYWHFKTLLPVLKVKIIRWKLSSNNELFIKKQNVIGNNPFKIKTITRHCATLNSCDFMLHLSNSSYAIALDESRCKWHVNKLGLVMRNDMEFVRPLIASTHFAFFIEVPMLADYQVEVRPVSWDNKWVYLMATFTTDPPKGSTTRIVNCISITRTVNKIGRRTVQPAKLFAACGFGIDETNWNQICKLREEGKSKGSKLSKSQEWLIDLNEFNGLNSFEVQRLENLEIIRKALDGNSLNGVELLKTL